MLRQLDGLLGSFYRLAIDLQDHIPRFEAGLGSRRVRFNIRDNNPVNGVRQIKLLSSAMIEITNSDAIKRAVVVLGVAVIFSQPLSARHFFYGHLERFARAIAQDLYGDGFTRTGPGHLELEMTAIGNLFAVKL